MEEGVYARKHEKWCRGFPEQKGKVEETGENKEASVQYWSVGVPQQKKVVKR